jgi:hypothetical protein
VQVRVLISPSWQLLATPGSHPKDVLPEDQDNFEGDVVLCPPTLAEKVEQKRMKI